MSPRVALVTGAAGGIGAAVVDLLAARGHVVVAADLRFPDRPTSPGSAPHATATSPSGPAATPGQVVPVRLDVTDESAVVRLVRWVEDEVGPLEVLVNAAGVLHAGVVTESSLADWQRMLAVNATGVYLVSREVARCLSSRRRGAIVTVASNAAGVPRVGMAAYAASKGGVAAMTLPLARDLADLRIRVMTIAPGIFSTPMMASLPAEAQESLAAQVPHPRRLGRPEEFARLVCAIVENPMLNGEVIRLDGGIRMAPR